MAVEFDETICMSALDLLCSTTVQLVVPRVNDPDPESLNNTLALSSLVRRPPLTPVSPT